MVGYRGSDGGVLGEFAFLALLGEGISELTVTEIDLLVDPKDPSAFPLKLAFNTLIMGWKGRSPFRGELGANQQ